MKHPLGMVALLYAGGLLIAELCRPPLPVLFGVSLLLAAGALIVPAWRAFLLWPLAVLTGWTMLVSHTVVVSPHDLRKLFDAEPQQVIVRAVLRETPRERTVIQDGVRYKHTMARADVLALHRGTNWEPAFGRVMVFAQGPAPTNIYAGQTVEIAGVLSQPPLPVAEGLFDYRNYLKRQGIYFELRAFKDGPWTALSSQPTKAPLSDRFLSWARAKLSLDLPEDDEALNLLLSMTLGWQADITNEIYEPFMQSGTMHIFAISGLHIALIAGILVAVLRAVRVPRLWSALIAIPLIWFYTAATGWQPSAIRSTIMMTVIAGGWALNRPGNLINSLGTAAFIILLWDPQQLFQASFQLSFLVVLSIALFQPPLEKLRRHLFQTDPLRPPRLMPRWRRWLHTPIHQFTAALTTSLAAWLGSWLLCAYYFHLFSPVTLLANLFIVPISSVALACNLASLLCGEWLPWATTLFNNCAWFCMSVIVWFSHRATELPGAYFHVRAPLLADFAIYYSAMFGALSGWIFAARRRAWTALGLATICAFYLWRWHLAQTTVQITILPLHGGSAAYCNAPGGKNDLLVDCGSSNSVDAVTKPFLWAQGVNRLPHVVLTHGNLRDIGGAELLYSYIPFDDVATSPLNFNSKVYENILSDLQKRTNLWRKVTDGDSLAGWGVLHPRNTDRFSVADDKAVVLEANHYGTRVLLLPELGLNGQLALLERKPDLRADIVIAGLPQQAEPLNEALLDLLQPKLIIITDSELPATRRAGETLRNRLEGRNIPILYTRLTNAVTISIRNNGWEAHGLGGKPITSASIKN